MLRVSGFVVVLEAVDNPTNLGAIVRSAAALGWDGLLLDSTSADPLARRALRVSMGTGLSLPFARLEPGENLVTALHRHGFVTCALTPDAAADDISTVKTARAAKIAVLLGLLLLLQDATFFAPKVFAAVIVACTLAWTFVEVWIFSRTKVLYVEPGGPK